MFYTHEELDSAGQAVGRVFSLCDALMKYGASRTSLITSFLKNLFFQEINYYKTFIRD